MPSIGLGLGLDKSQGLILAPEAVAWASAVVTAGSSVPASVVFAVSEFVKGCQADASPNAGVNNWTAMKSVQLLVGPATFAGISAPLKGVAPTFFNFVGGDYNPATGLIGNALNKYLNSERNNNADPQNNKSMGVWSNSAPTTGAARTYMGCGDGSGTDGQSLFSRSGTSPANLNGVLNCDTFSGTGNGADTGFFVFQRIASGEFTKFVNGVSTTFSVASQTPLAGNIFVFGSNNSGSVIFPTDARLAFYFIGEGVSRTALNNRLTTLMAAIAAAHQ